MARPLREPSHCPCDRSTGLAGAQGCARDSASRQGLSAATTAAVNTLPVVAKALLKSERVRVRMTHTVLWTDAFHQTTITAPVQRPVTHVMSARVVDDAGMTSALRRRVDVLQHHVVLLYAEVWLCCVRDEVRVLLRRVRDQATHFGITSAFMPGGITNWPSLSTVTMT